MLSLSKVSVGNCGNFKKATLQTQQKSATNAHYKLSVACRVQIFEKKPTTVKNFGVWVRYQSRTGYHNMYKEYRDTTLNGAVEQLYQEMASRHRCAHGYSAAQPRNDVLQQFLKQPRAAAYAVYRAASLRQPSARYRVLSALDPWRAAIFLGSSVGSTGLSQRCTDQPSPLTCDVGQSPCMMRSR